MLAPTGGRTRIRLALATPEQRETIYRMRHEVYARELRQHAENSEGMLTDPLDAFNEYITASLDGEVVGFVSITPPGHGRYSIDKYLKRDELPFPCDERLYEVRLLTVAAPYRGRPIAGLLMYAALRWIAHRGGKRIVAIGRREVLDLYRKVGLQTLGRTIQSGAVQYELMAAATDEIQGGGMGRYTRALQRLEPTLDWQLDVPLYPPAPCFHGGAFWCAIGDKFDRLDRAGEVINADVLDAWFPPAPGVLNALRDHLPFLVRTSPPAECAGLIQTISRVRGVPTECILPGEGSSRLIFQSLRHWLSPTSRVLILDPMYGEYAHVLERVVGCHVDRLELNRRNNYRLETADLAARLGNNYDLIVLVNPNSPTGQHVPRSELESVLRHAPARTRIWVDETYVEYAGPGQSLESFAATSENTIVCKSMSKVYALSGLRIAYLCAAPRMIDELRVITPPWAVSLPGQVAAVTALADPNYYTGRYKETHELRAELVKSLRKFTSWEIIPGVANFVLCHLPADGPDARSVCERCRAHGLFLRDASTMTHRPEMHALRLAVKDAVTNRRMVEIIGRTQTRSGNP